MLNYLLTPKSKRRVMNISFFWYTPFKIEMRQSSQMREKVFFDDILSVKKRDGTPEF